MSLQVVVDFSVVDESSDWLVVEKPAPLIVHPANRKPEPTLLGGIERLLAFEMANGAKPAIVNRLDRDTSGLVLVAKHTLAARELGIIFERREVAKEYLAIVHGWPDADEWVNAQPILREGELGPALIWVRQVVHSAGRECLTRFKVEQRFQVNGRHHAMVRCFPETGRMHQIRVHLAHDGFPIVGDKLYSGEGSAYLEWMRDGWTPQLQEKLLLPRHALHASSLTLTWQGRLKDWRIGLPQDLERFVRGEANEYDPRVIEWCRHADSLDHHAFGE
ncbi:MAG: RluA family pseudouridine synthase [Luteolibacter sp.]